MPLQLSEQSLPYMLPVKEIKILYPAFLSKLNEIKESKNNLLNQSNISHYIYLELIKSQLKYSHFRPKFSYVRSQMNR